MREKKVLLNDQNCAVRKPHGFIVQRKLISKLNQNYFFATTKSVVTSESIEVAVIKLF